MTSKYSLLNLLLFFAVIFLAYENYGIWFSPSGAGLKKAGGKKSEMKVEPSPVVLTRRAPAPGEDFKVISEKNIFHPERKEFSMVGSAAMAQPTTRPAMTLYGVAITENYQAASVVSPGRVLPKGERQMKTLKIGDSIGEYKLTKIMPDRIVMEAGEDSFEVLLYDPRTPKRRAEVKTPTRPASITSTAPIPPPPPRTPPAVVAPASPASPPAAATMIPQTPVPLPGASSPVREGISQPPVTPPAAPDPGVWRGRIPGSPTVQPGQPGWGR